jgi:uncharacterized protein
VKNQHQFKNPGKLRRALLIAAGSLSLGLGVLGILLPLLPTTPFLLLSAACYLRSSERLYNWLMNHRLFGRIISDYLHHRSISLPVKISSLSLLWLTIGYSALFVVSKLWVSILLVLIAVGVTIHILSFKSKKK